MQGVTAKLIFDGNNFLEKKVILIKNNVIIDIVESETIDPKLVVDYGTGVISAGFIDLQVNGGGGVLFNEDISLATLEKIYQTCIRFGTTYFLPTLITCNFNDILQSLNIVKEWFNLYGNNRGVLGIHLEGPFISKDKKGIHPEEYIIAPQQELLEQIVGYCKYFPIKMTIAVERFTNEQILYLKNNGVIISIGHSNATYEQTVNSFNYGITNATHLFNAMSGMTSRNPGVICAVLNNDVYAGIIADLIHVDLANINFLHKVKNGKVYLITDAVTPVGTDMKEFIIAGKKLLVKEGKCINELGILGGANLTMNKAVYNCVNSCNIKLIDALKMATTIPAEVMQVKNIGKIKKGFNANLIHIDLDSPDYSCKLISMI